MRFFLACCLATLFAGCASVKTPSDYSNQRLKEDSIDWEYNARNDMLDQPDGGDTFRNRNINFIGVTY